jgi:hypothetical protein
LALLPDNVEQTLCLHSANLKFFGTSNSVPVAFVEDGVNFGEERVIFVNIDPQ